MEESESVEQEQQAENRSIAEVLKAAKLRSANHKESIAEEEKKINEADGGDHAARQQELAEARAKVVVLEQDLKHQHQSIEALKKDMADGEMERDERNVRVRVKSDEVKACRTQLDMLLKAQNGQTNSFHPKMHLLLRAIQEEKSFVKAPIGPIGMHVKLLKPKWSSVLEKSFGGALSAFIVQSKSDQARLSSIMKDVGWFVRPSILLASASLTLSALAISTLATDNTSTQRAASRTQNSTLRCAFVR